MKTIISILIALFFINPILIFAQSSDEEAKQQALEGYLEIGKKYAQQQQQTNQPNAYQNFLQNVNTFDQTSELSLVKNPNRTTETQTQQYNDESLTPDYTDSRIDAAISRVRGTNTTGTASSSTSSGNVAAQSGAGLIGCAGGQVLANVVSSAVTSAIGGTVSNIVDSIFNVPISEQGSVGNNIKTETSARVGTVAGAFGISGLVLPSWDAVAYCIVNAMIAYIADSTIAWINTGFQGNPAFLENPDAFFKELANEEAAGFIQGLAYGTLGKNICNVFKANIILTVANQYTGGYGSQGGGYDTGGFQGSRGINNGYGGCTFDENTLTLDRFLKGDFIQGGGWDSWYQLSQNQSNNPYDVYFNVTDKLTAGVNKAIKSTETELSWNKGFLTYKKCDNAADNSKLNKSNCKSVTPGTVIEQQLNSTLDQSKNRLVMADKFDQVVSALVNQLIQTAIGKTLEVIRN